MTYTEEQVNAIVSVLAKQRDDATNQTIQLALQIVDLKGQIAAPSESPNTK